MIQVFFLKKMEAVIQVDAASLILAIICELVASLRSKTLTFLSKAPSTLE